VIVRKRILFGIVFGIALAADLVTKWAAFRFLALGERFRVVGGFFDLEKAENFGIVFGVKAPPAITMLVSAAATAIILWYLMTPKGRPAVVQVYLGCILTGVIGNLYDRLAFGYVRDFALLYVGEHRWPNFNLADAFILIGVVLAMVQFILTEEPSKKKDALRAKREPAEESAGDAPERES
jgi:signal peptidase II